MLRKLALAAVAYCIAAPGSVWAVEVISATKVTSLKWTLINYTAMGFSPDGGNFLLGERLADGHAHYCIYDSGTLRRIKCVARLLESKSVVFGDLQWLSDDRIVAVGGSLIGWFSVEGWRNSNFQEPDATGNFSLQSSRHGRCPAWDRIEGALYFGSRETMGLGGIVREKNGSLSYPFNDRVYCVYPDETYFWYSEIGKFGAALRRQHRKTKKVDIITDGRLDDSQFAVAGSGRLLFVRDLRPIGSAPLLYAYSDETGVRGPIYGPAREGELVSVQVDQSGSRALVSISDQKHSSEGNNLSHIYMLQLVW